MAVTNSVIAGNTADFGGGVFCSGPSTPAIRSCTITGNNAPDGGGIYSYGSTVTIVNTIVVANSSGMYKTPSTVLSLRYNCVYGNTAYNYVNIANPTGINGNISADPLLLQAPIAGLAWRLRPGSPCIDAGNNVDVLSDAGDVDGDSDTFEILPLDAAGAGRFADNQYTVDSGSGTAPIVDMGA